MRGYDCPESVYDSSCFIAEGTYTGGGFSPARVLGNAIVHQCNWGQVRLNLKAVTVIAAFILR